MATTFLVTGFVRFLPVFPQRYQFRFVYRVQSGIFEKAPLIMWNRYAHFTAILFQNTGCKIQAAQAIGDRRQFTAVLLDLVLQCPHDHCICCLGVPQNVHGGVLVNAVFVLEIDKQHC